MRRRITMALRQLHLSGYIKAVCLQALEKPHAQHFKKPNTCRKQIFNDLQQTQKHIVKFVFSVQTITK